MDSETESKKSQSLEAGDAVPEAVVDAPRPASEYGSLAVLRSDQEQSTSAACMVSRYSLTD